MNAAGLSSAQRELAALPNLGPASARMLVAAGVDRVQVLRELGPLQTYLQVWQFHREQGLAKPSLNLLWALAGAVHNCHWNQLPQGLRSALLLELDARDEAP